ncbi:porin [Burkholderia anthina]|uniref:porin n=1 Tax=Burkholderia anthina TaxID=179879 RepID=UPI00158BEDE8
MHYLNKTIFQVMLAAFAFSTQSAHAQSSVTFYGNVDTGVGYFSNVGGKSLYAAVDSNFIPNLFGFSGSEDLGDGLKALFKLEAGFALSSGALTVPGEIFQRQAYVGLSSDKFGTLTMGHQSTFGFDTLLPFSVGYVGGTYTVHQGNFDELANSFEFNNSVKYVSPTYAGLSFATAFGFGNQAGNFANGRNYSFSLRYKNGPLALGATYENENNRFLELVNLVGLKSLLGTPLPQLNGVVANKMENWGIGGSYELGDWTLHGLFTQSRITLTTGRGNANTIDAGADYLIRKVDSVGVGISVENLDGGRWTTVNLSNIYFLSKRTKLYQQVMYQKASGENAVAALSFMGPASGNSQLGVVVGIQHFF